jgi:excinuclease ABC subunit C
MSPRDRAALLPLTPGVYRFRDAAGHVLYLGRATHLRRRVTSYWGDLSGRPHLRRMVPRIARVEAVVCASVHEAAWLERNLLTSGVPRWNRAHTGGQEVEVWIQLSDAARSPGLTVTHLPPQESPGRYSFGPYLGGKQVRLAVSGLSRILPLQYASAELSGMNQDLARIRGVSAADRETLAATAAAVLDRDPSAVTAVRGQLIERRDAAAADLGFEQAARLQQEIAALDWVTAPQQVTRPEPADHEVCGWSGGTLVRFSIRAGRLTGWTQRACAEKTAQAHLDATAPDWQQFARRNADLAAHLVAGNGR